MSLRTEMAVVDPTALPRGFATLGVRIEREAVHQLKGDTKEMVLITPASKLLSEEDAIGPEPNFRRVLCGVDILGDDVVARGSGQLVITAQRFICMLDQGMGGTGRTKGNGKQLGLDLSSPGNILLFTCGRRDVGQPKITKKRLKPSNFKFQSIAGQSPSFVFEVFAAYAYVVNKKVNFWHDKNMVDAIAN